MVTQDDIQKAAHIIRAGGLVVFPTETVYGLGANALDPSAIRKIYDLKGRPAHSPLIVHVSSIAQARGLAAEWPEQAERLAQQYWPGPLTLVVPKKAFVPDEVTAGLPTVGLRMPRHPIALALIREAGVPIAAPSANRFSGLSPTTAEHVRQAFGDNTPFLLDGGPCEVGLESTVVAITDDGLEVLRPGMAQIEEAEPCSTAVGASGPGQSSGGLARGEGECASSATLEGETPHRAPGQHAKHYSPRTRLVLVTRGHLPHEGRGAYLWLNYNASATQKLRMPESPAEYAAQLYSKLHELDRLGLDWIAVELPPDEPEWAAIRDRLTRAAG